MIRVEPEETQDNVKESLNLSRKKAEEIRLVLSAIIPQSPMFWCDNRCSDKALSFWQLVSVVEDGEESYTANLCQQCYNEKLVAMGGSWQWYAVVEEKAHRGRLWRTLGERPVHPGNVGVFFL